MHILIRGTREAGGWAKLEAVQTLLPSLVDDTCAGNQSKIVDLWDDHGSNFDWGTVSLGSRLTAQQIIFHLMPKYHVKSWPNRSEKYALRLYRELILNLPRGDWHRTDVQLLKVIFPKNFLARWWWTWKIRGRKVRITTPITIEVKDNRPKPIKPTVVPPPPPLYDHRYRRK